MAVNDIVMGAAGASGPATFVEDVFSTWLYTANGANRSIVNGIDLSTKGGMVLFKSRLGTASSAYGWGVFDTNRGVQKGLRTNDANTQITSASSLTAFNTNGFNLGTDDNALVANTFSGALSASWTFRKQPKFFDVVTYTGDGVAGRQIAHSLGSAPGAIIVKCTNVTRDWAVWHRTLADGTYLKLNTTDTVITNTSFQVFGDASGQTSSVFTVGKTGSGVNGLTNANSAGDTYVAYLFAHDAGGFGALGTDNVISCGIYTGNGSATGPVVTLGYEPQWLMIKNATVVSGNWQIIDNMRGMSVGFADATLQANLTNAETSVDYASPAATGFQITSTSTEVNTNAATYIYIAIRRPMKTPTTGTEVFSPITSAISSGKLTTGFPVDLQWVTARTYGSGTYDIDRLRGVSTNTSASARLLLTQLTSAESANSDAALGWDNTGYQVPIQWAGNSTSYWNFKRAPGFFDVVCYTGTGVARTLNHNLTVVPEMMIVKSRSGAGYSWCVYSAAIGNTLRLELDSTSASVSSLAFWNSTTPTSSVFTVGTNGNVNANTITYVAYLFATVAGVSKVGSYTGNGSSQTINCSFTTGARFVMIKRTDSTGDWYVWDTARGIVAGNDPHLSLNTTAAEVTTDDSVDADSSGFIVNQLAATNINVTSASYIFLAIA